MDMRKKTVVTPTLSDGGKLFPSCFQLMSGNGNPHVCISILIGSETVTCISFSRKLLK